MANIDLSGLNIDQLAELVTQTQSEMASREKRRRMRNPVKVVTRSTGNVVTDSTVSDHLSERSDAGVGFKSRGDQFG